MENVPTAPVEGARAAQPSHRPARGRRRSLVGPLLLIAVGLLFLGQNLGLLTSDVWLSIWRLWPLVLVLVGVELMFGRSNWGAAISITLLVLVIGGFAAATAYFGPAGRWTFGNWSAGGFAPAAVDRVAEELGDISRATIDLRHGAGTLDIAALPSDSTGLIDAELAHGENRSISREVTRSNSEATVQLRGRTEQGGFPFGSTGGDEWTINLSQKIPMELDVRTGASDVEMDLSELKVTRFAVDAGASSLDVITPAAAGRTEGRIKAGAASVDVTIPEGVAARIRVRSGLAGTTVDESRFPKAGSYYQSRDYDTAENRLDLDIETGVSGLTIR